MERNNLEELESLLDACPYLTWIKDEEDRLVYINKIYGDTLGKSKEEIIGNKEKELWGIDLSNRYVYSVSTEVYLEVYEMNLYEGDTIVGKKGVAKDITLDKKIIQQFELAYNNIVGEIGRNYESHHYKEIIGKFKKVGEELSQHLQADDMIVLLEDRTTQLYDIWYSEGFDKEEQEELYFFVNNHHQGRTYYGSMVTDEIQDINDLKNSKYKSMLSKKGISTIMRYPITFNGKIIGVIIVYNPKKIPDFHMSSICLYMGVIIKKLMLSERTMSQIKNRVESEQELQLFFEKSTQIMISIDKEDNIKLIGSIAKSVLGWNNDEICKYIKNDIKIQDYIEQARKSRDKFIKVEKRCVCKDGSYKEIRWTIRYSEEEQSTMIIGEDITKRKKEEEEYLRLQVEMELEYIKGELLSCMSNEFKTPVNTILYTIELLQGKVEDRQIRVVNNMDLDKYMGLIRQNAYRLIRLINNLVDSNSIENGEYSLKLRPHNIVEIIEDITRSVEEYVGTKGIGLKFETVVDELKIVCDPDKIERIMLNLISNAIKYTEEGGQINIRIKQDDTYIYIHVSDNGEGISKNKLVTIFDRFAQGENGLTRKREGSGIGLSLVKSLVQMHKGEIKVRSKVGIGTEFIVKLPIIKVLEDEPEDAKLYGVNNNTEVWNIEFADIYE